MLAGVELGGTKCICILASGPDDVREQIAIPTTTPEATLEAIGTILDSWDYATLGLASFGPLDLDPASPNYASIINTTKLQWSGTSLLSLARDKPFAIDTDVNGAALAEGSWGAAQGLDSWAYITFGTGIGVGSVCSGRPLSGFGHSEAGHQRVPRFAFDAFEGICAFHGDCVEGLASGPAIEARAGAGCRDIAADDPAWNFAAHAIAMLCHNLVLTTLPQRILIGGGVAMGQPHMLPRIRQHLAESLGGYANTARITDNIDEFIMLPALGNNAGPLGAVRLALDAYQTTG